MKGPSRRRVLGVLLTAVVAIVVATGIVLVGPPSEERARRLDARRVADLAGLARAVDAHWRRHSSLPPSLNELRQEFGGTVAAADPGTAAPYEYRPLDAPRYELCARFDRDSEGGDHFDGDPAWSHRAGRQCFPREAKKLH